MIKAISLYSNENNRIMIINLIEIDDNVDILMINLYCKTKSIQK